MSNTNTSTNTNTNTIERFTGEGDLQRKLFALAVDVSGASTNSVAPKYVVAGYKIEKSSMEINPGIETMTDILGNTYTTLNKFEPSQTFEPHRLYTGNELGEMLLQFFRDRNLEKFTSFRCVYIYGFLGGPGAYSADYYSQCSIIPKSIGGSSYVEMPFTVNFGGEIKKGTASGLRGEIVFTEI